MSKVSIFYKWFSVSFYGILLRPPLESKVVKCILNLETLEYRRLIFDLILVYKILHNYTSLDVRDYFAFYDTRSRSYANFALKPLFTSTKNVVSSFFSFRVVKYWNLLPKDVVNARSLVEFKRLLHNVSPNKLLCNSGIRFNTPPHLDHLCLFLTSFSRWTRCCKNFLKKIHFRGV